MSCPDWNRLVRDGDPTEPLPTDVRRHVADCAQCQENALLLDPTLVFQRMPTVEVSAADIEAMKSGVAALRHAHEVENRVVPLDARRPARRSSGWLQLGALAAMLLVAVLLAPVAFEPPGTDDTDAVAQTAGAYEMAAPEVVPAFDDSVFANEALIGEVDAHEVVQLDHDDFSLVLVLTDTLDGEDLNV